MSLKAEKIKEKIFEIESRSMKTADIVSNIAEAYSGTMDHYINKIFIKMDEDVKLSDTELEEAILKIPVYTYFAIEGLETLGSYMDLTGNEKKEKLNQIYLDESGTIPERTKVAELGTMEEETIENIYRRAYKMLSVKVQKADNIYTSLKKIYDKRLKEIDVQSMDSKYKDLSGMNHIDNK